ncbi:MAG: DegV family protein [Clostridia bacterium]|nr:DegV family protein [Clostridia bacterium]
MQNFTIITDSSSDLTPGLCSQLNVKVLPLSFFIEGKQYYNDPLNPQISHKDFYKQLSDGKMVTTSALNPEQFREAMEHELIAGNDVLYLGFSSALSGTYNAGVLAAEELNEKYPSRKVYTVDTRCASLGQGLLVYYACLERDKGKTIEEVRDYAESIKGSICHWFTVSDLYQLKRGGRISGVTAALGTMLSIKPVLHVDDDGRLINMFKARGRNASILALFNKMKESAIDPKNQTIFISHGDCFDDAKRLGDKITEEYGCKCVIGYVGPVIGAHSGKGTVALFFLGKER